MYLVALGIYLKLGWLTLEIGVEDEEHHGGDVFGIEHQPIGRNVLPLRPRDAWRGASARERYARWSAAFS